MPAPPHPNAIGFIGMHGHAHVNRAVDKCDVLIVALGARFDDRNTGSGRTDIAPTRPSST